MLNRVTEFWLNPACLQGSEPCFCESDAKDRLAANQDFHLNLFRGVEKLNRE